MPYKRLTAAAAAATTGQILRSGYDLTALASNDWEAGGATRSLTPDTGTVTASLTWNLVNQAAGTSWGPDGSTGIVWELPSNLGDWGNTAVPATVPYASILLSDLIGSTPTLQTEVILGFVLAGAAASDTFEFRAGGIGDASHAFDVRNQAVGGGSNVNLVRHTPTQTGATGVAPATADWFALRVCGGEYANARYGTGAIDWSTGTDVPNPTSFGTAGTAVPPLDIANSSVILMACTAANGGAWTTTFSGLHVWEVVL